MAAKKQSSRSNGDAGTRWTRKREAEAAEAALKRTLSRVGGGGFAEKSFGGGGLVEEVWSLQPWGMEVEHRAASMVS